MSSTATSSSSLSTVDFASKINKEDHELVSRLHQVSKNSPKLIRSTQYTAPADPSIHLRSWKMNEFKYYDIPSPFPTLARGVFTQEVKVADEIKYRIVVRGYDKFFNIGEVPWNSWAALEQHTQPPYTLTLKSNGCIIFIAALTPTKLVVTSKHAVGAANEPQAHSQVGYKWLLKHLESVGRTEEDLSKFLWEKNWTAVAELCDDSFEEHVLPYGKEETGLHLHGLNECSKHFKTMLQDVVDSFASEWGFIQTASVVFQTIPEVKAFTDEVGSTGKWHGKALEGFVVRTHVSSHPPTRGDKPASASPYEPGSSFFFKVKFDEPYMMYRDWREVTKSLLSKGLSQGNVPRNKLRRPETKAYVQWVINEVNRDPKPFADYNKGRGIIATRELFLEWLETPEGQDVLKGVKTLSLTHQAVSKDSEGTKEFGKTVIVPVAIPGVGKTSIAVALVHLFGFGHTQSDDVQAKKPAPIFVKNVVNLLKKHDVVIADKNNHLIQHRQQLRDATRSIIPPVRLMAFNWSFDIPLSTIHRVCSDRISTRGENHQTLRADDNRSYEDVLWNFLKQAEGLKENEVDVSIEMDIEEDLESALKRAVDACVEVLGVPRPEVEKMGEALAIVRGYSPKTKRNTKKESSAPTPRYYALLPEFDMVMFMKEQAGADGVPPEGKAFWDELLKNGRTGDRVPHITLVHSKSLHGDNQQLWDRSRELSKNALFTFRLDSIIWDDRVMAIVVEDLAVSTDDGLDLDSEERTKAADYMLKMPSEVKDRLHITVGTRSKDIPAVEAKDLVARWRAGEKQNIGEFALGDVWMKGRVKGLMR